MTTLHNPHDRFFKAVFGRPEVAAEFLGRYLPAEQAMFTCCSSTRVIQNRTAGSAESQHDMLRRLELTRERHEALIAHCHGCGIGFFSTGFDLESVDLLVELGIDCPPDRQAIAAALEKLYSPAFQESLKLVRNPYGVGGASEKVVEVLRHYPLDGLLKKSFFNLPVH